MALDDPTLIESNEPASMNATVLRYGVIGGLVFIVVSLLGYLTGFSSPTDLGKVMINLLISMVVYIGLMVVAIRHHRDQDLGGYITFGRAFLVGLLVVLIAGVIANVFNYLYISMIDPEYLSNMARDMQGMYERMGMSEEQMEAAMQQVENLTPGRIVVQGLVGGLIIGGISSAIVAAIMKRKPED